MKALTIHQPWASLLACGVKKYETRGWKTNYRDPIAIHASKQDPCKLPLLDKRDLERITRDAIDAKRCPGWCVMPTGAIIAIGELVNVWGIVYHPGTNIDIAKNISIGAESLTLDKHDPHFGDYFVPTEQEQALGDWTPGRYAWEIKITRILDHPYKIRGQQGLWNFDIALLASQDTDHLLLAPAT